MDIPRAPSCPTLPPPPTSQPFPAEQHAEFVHRSWPADPHELAGLRADVRQWLNSVGLTVDAQQDLLCAVSEAASNSIEHAYPDPGPGDAVELTFWTEPDRVWIEIVDRGGWRTPPADNSGRGLGIPMMQRLVDSVLIRYDERGTRVLLGHPLPGDARELPPARYGPAILDTSGLRPAPDQPA